ncbi:MAG TPA: hypothetical protein VF002_00045 [Gaiellaceae bacterium]
MTELTELLPGRRFRQRRSQRRQARFTPEFQWPQFLADELLSELIVSYQELYAGSLCEPAAQSRVRRALVLAMVASLAMWLVIGIAVFELVAALP